MDTSLTWLQNLTKSPSGDDWRRLAEAYGPLLIKWTTRAGIPPSDRDDLVQEVMIVVARRVKEFEHAHPGAFRGWLRAILSNQIKKYFREHPGPVCMIPLEDVANSESVLSSIFDREHDEYFAARAMRMAKVDFEPVTWRAFEMQVLDGRTPKETSETLKLSLNAVIKAKSRVLKRLRQELGRIVD